MRAIRNGDEGAKLLDRRLQVVVRIASASQQLTLDFSRTLVIVCVYVYVVSR